jgi:hypothetical protein
MDYNWPLFDGAHVLVRTEDMSVEQLQEGYFHFLREAYSLTGIARRFRGKPSEVGSAISHLFRNYLFSRYGMTKTAYAMRRKGPKRAGGRATAATPLPEASPAPCPNPQAVAPLQPERVLVRIRS